MVLRDRKNVQDLVRFSRKFLELKGFETLGMIFYYINEYILYESINLKSFLYSQFQNNWLHICFSYICCFFIEQISLDILLLDCSASIILSFIFFFILNLFFLFFAQFASRSAQGTVLCVPFHRYDQHNGPLRSLQAQTSRHHAHAHTYTHIQTLKQGPSRTPRSRGNSFNGQLVDLAFWLGLLLFLGPCGLRAMKRKKGLLYDKITFTHTHTHTLSADSNCCKLKMKMSLLVLLALNARAKRALKPLRLPRLLNTIFYCTTNHRYTQHPLEPIYTRMHTHTLTHTHARVA